MTTSVVLATNNARKLAELRRIIIEEQLDIEVLGLGDVTTFPEPAETESSFEGNALIKARAAAQHTGLIALADDSGICVDALNQMPGVRSARWAGPQHDDLANLDLLLAQISDVDDPYRTARFVAAMALVTSDGREFTSRGEMPGRIAEAPRGTGGFGYDPIFIPDDGEADLTTAQMTPEAKDAISHRGKAVRGIIGTLAAVTGAQA